MLKRNVFKFLGVVFFLLSAITFYFSINNQISQPIKPTLPAVVLTKAGSTNNILGREDRAPTKRLNPSSTTYQLQPTIYLSPTHTDYRPPITESPSNTPSPTNYPLPTTTSLSVSLSVAGSSADSFEIPPGSNQCDLLTQALSQGKIQSLNMRYNNDMGTNAVYQINGIGKENAVWWTFKVNGHSPNQGCSYIKVNNGDSVLWEYVGN
jgi:hypothetical protein